MDYVFLDEAPMEMNYRYLAWMVFQYFSTHNDILKIEKYKKVYSEIFDFFIKRKKTQLNITECSKEEIKRKAITEYYSFLHRKRLTINEINDFVENYDNCKHLLVIRPKNKTS